MKRNKELNGFYSSKAWRRVRWIVLHKYRGICQSCGKAGREVHHIIPLTQENVHDASIALNVDNLLLLCESCHNSMRGSEVHLRNDVYFDGDGNLLQKAAPPIKKR